MGEITAGASVEPEREFYDRAYSSSNYFHYDDRLFGPFIRGLIAISGLKKGAQVLDAGCGQGFFSHLLSKEGLEVFSTDISLVGLAAARAAVGGRSSRVFASDLNHSAFIRPFDGVFIRSCTLFNTTDLARRRRFIDTLHGMVKPGGIVMFVYNTNLSGPGGNWTHHRLEDLRASFTMGRTDIAVYLVNKVDVLVLGSRAFNRTMTRANERLARLTGWGAEAVILSRVASA